IDRALRRVLGQKAELGLLDPDWSPVPPALDGVDLADPEALRGSIDLDRSGNRELAREIAEKAVVLLSNDGTLPLTRPRRIALVGPNATEATAVLGCYSFPRHVGVQHPEVPVGIDLPTLHDTLTAEFPEADITVARGTGVDDGELSDIGAAVDAARGADVVVAVLGDRAG
ncbi:glycosyl hydrolase, partial [Streptomyces sp. SID5914]